MSPCRFLFPNGDTACRVGDMSRHVRGHVGDNAKCRVGQGAQNDITCRPFADMSANVGNSVIGYSAQTYQILQRSKVGTTYELIGLWCSVEAKPLFVTVENSE